MRWVTQQNNDKSAVHAVRRTNLCDVHAILAIEELNDRAVGVAHGQIVAHAQVLQVLDQTALQVAGRVVRGEKVVRGEREWWELLR